MRTERPQEACPSGTQHLSDLEFVDAFESLELANEQFRHYDHVRLAWIYLRATSRDGKLNVARATERMAQGIRAFAVHHGGSLEKYHETITRAFVHFVAAHCRVTPKLDQFGDFASAHLELLDKNLPLAFYSKARLMSREARTSWVEPDLAPLPQ